MNWLVKVFGLGFGLALILGGFWYFGLSQIEHKSLGDGLQTQENSLETQWNCCDEFRENPQIISTNLISQKQLETLEKDIVGVLGDEKDKYSIVLVETSSEKRVEINSEVDRLPASISKVPYAILMLKEVQEQNLSLDSELTLNWWHKAYPTDELWYLENGSGVSVADLLEYLIIESDNTAMTLIEDYFGGVDEFNQKIKEIGITGLTRYPHITTASSVANMMEGIEDGRFLDSLTNQHLMELMGRTNPKYHDRIIAGLPDGTRFAHKIGQLFSDEYTEAYNDAAIVFGDESDYILVVLNENINASDAAQKTERISQMVYENLN